MIDREKYRVAVEQELGRRCPLAGQFELTVVDTSGYVVVSLPHKGKAIELGKFPNAWWRRFERDPAARQKILNAVDAACKELERLAKELT